MHRLFPSPKYIEQRCFRKLIALLPPRMQEHILYAYRRGEILYFVLKHPGFVMEFNYNKKHINEVLKLLQSRYPQCQKLKITTIKGYHKFIPQPQEQPSPLLRYTERALGNFTIATQNEELRALLEKIQEAIKKNAARNDQKSS